MCIHTNEPDYVAIETMRANERMGRALDFIYRQYPHIKTEVLEYMAQLDDLEW